MKKYRSISVSNDAGFTLLEILIAITLLAFISLGVVNITENAVQTKERTTQINENNLQIETAMSRFEWDFSQIYSPLYFSTVMNMNQLQNGQNIPASSNSGPQGLNNSETPNNNNKQPSQTNPMLQQYYEQLINRFERNEHFSSVSSEGYPIPRFYSPDKDVFEFFTSSNRRKIENQKQSHFAWVRYALTSQEQTEEEEENLKLPKSLKSLVRYFAPDDPYGDKRIDIEDEQRVKGVVLLRNVEKIEFNFWDPVRRKWQTSLRSIQDGENIVRGIKFIITWYDSYGAKKTTSRIFRPLWPQVNPSDANFGQANGQLSNSQGDINGSL
jgi:prepilin-type N-terminal cleavage/methylation domain-containing protein